MRIDSTSVKIHAGISPEGLFQVGQSKDYRPNLPQVKMTLPVLDLLGQPLTNRVVEGRCADGPLYIPEIKQLPPSLGPSDKTWSGGRHTGCFPVTGGTSR